jgi:plasmid stabilization system protein ParE
LSYRLLAGAEADIDRILLESARAFGVDAAERCSLLMRSVFAALAAVPDRPGSQEIATAAGVRVYPLRIGRRLVVQEQRVGSPRRIVVYRVGSDGMVEIIGLAHGRMLLSRAVRQMRRAAEAE